jgi:poly-gamma-glutamate synthesis protein (capsule biosynthesis protein)
MRAFTHYEQIEHDQPGTPSRIRTFAHSEDLEALKADIAAARGQADVVVVSLHWGIHFVPAVIADYQREVAHAAVDAGADLILGHHAHILKGVEVYRGKAIFYSLGNFAIDLRMTEEHAKAKSFREIQALNPDWTVNTASLFNFPRDSQKTLVVKALLRDRALAEVSFLPAYIDDMTAVPELLSPEDPRFDEVVTYVHAMSAMADLGSAGVQNGGEVLIAGSGTEAKASAHP